MLISMAILNLPEGKENSSWYPSGSSLYPLCWCNPSKIPCPICWWFDLHVGLSKNRLHPNLMVQNFIFPCHLMAILRVYIMVYPIFRSICWYGWFYNTINHLNKCKYICIHIHICVLTYVYTYVYICIHMHIYIIIIIYIYACIYVEVC